MTTTVGRLLSLTEASRSRIALAVAFGTLTVVFGVGLMATAGYLISRAAERPAILSLTVAIVGVRFFGLARPVVRYFERLSSHDVALRALGRVRVRVYERLERLAPTQLVSNRRGDLSPGSSRMSTRSRICTSEESHPRLSPSAPVRLRWEPPPRSYRRRRSCSRPVCWLEA